MAVEVEDRIADAQARQPGFLLRFAQRRLRQFALAIGVPTQLQPQAQLAVVGQQHARAAAIHQPARGGEMTGKALATERIFGIGQQFAEQRDGGSFFRPACGITIQRGVQGCVHRGFAPRNLNALHYPAS